jgi:L-talarate/galactarate dehydratase
VNVTAAQVRVVNRPCEPPFAIDWMTITETVYIVCELYSVEDMGLGFCFSFDQRHAQAMAELTTSLVQQVFGSGRTPAPASLRRDLRVALALTGYPGIGISCAAAIEIAAWDLFVRSAKAEWNEYFGRRPDAEYPAYVTCGSVTSAPDVVADEVLRALGAGYHLVKIKVGNDEARDSDRVRAAREAAGPACGLLLDANQTWDTRTAQRLINRWEKYDLFWVEEPLAADDITGLARLHDRVGTRIATGESYYDSAALRQIIDNRAADVLTVNPQKVGGVAAFEDIVAASNLVGMGITCHTFGEIAGSLLGGADIVPCVEIVPWMHGVFADAPVVREGRLRATPGPAFGLRISSAGEGWTTRRTNIELR